MTTILVVASITYVAIGFQLKTSDTRSRRNVIVRLTMVPLLLVLVAVELWVRRARSLTE